MSQQILTLTERIADVRYNNPVRISNFQTFYELTILLMSMV